VEGKKSKAKEPLSEVQTSKEYFNGKKKKKESR